MGLTRGVFWLSKRIRLLGVLAFLFLLLLPVIPVKGLLNNGYIVGPICVFAVYMRSVCRKGRFRHLLCWMAPFMIDNENKCYSVSSTDVRFMHVHRIA